MRSQRLLLPLAVLPLSLLAAPALGWESNADWTAWSWVANTHGRANARVYYDSEHREMFEAILGSSGLPAAWNAEATIWVPVDDSPTWYTSPTLALTGEPWTLIPVDPKAADRYRARTLVPSMFAELPDFAYSMWDWMSGAETCPAAPPSTTGDACYAFAGWMGTLNSTHFVPQATTLYFAAHTTALGLAAQCADYHAAMGYAANDAGPIPDYLLHTLDCGPDGLCPGDAGYSSADAGELDGNDDFLEQCMVQALMLESYGHHYFEDSWSSGHMWHRWGGPHAAHFPNLRVGLATAMTSGMIHGSRSVTHMDDRMCQANEWRYAWGATVGPPLPSGHPAYSLSGFPYGVYPGVGDLYLGNIGGMQDQIVDECERVSTCEVYAAGATIWGPAPSCSQPFISNSGDARCHDQRATNRAIWLGSGLQMGWAGNFPLNGTFVYGMIRAKSGVGSAALACAPSTASTEVTCLDAELSRVHTGYHVGAILDPNGVGLSTDSGPMALGAFMGVGANEAYGMPSFADSTDMPWDGLDAAGSPSTKELVMLRGMHRGNAEYWCEHTAREDLYDMRQRCLNETGDTKEAACRICEEFAARHIRIGCGPDDYEEDREPLCALIADDPEDVAYLYWNMDPSVAMTEDAADVAGDFCRDPEDYNIGPCVSAYAFGDYEIAYCAAVFYPFFYCSSCSQCVGIGEVLAVNESGWEDSDISLLWTSADAGFGDPTAWDTSLISYDILWPPTCFYEDYGYAFVDLDACDPYGNCSWDWDSAEFTCYGSPY